jgi:Coenzyme PQQ synthesis protein D (PqqD)
MNSLNPIDQPMPAAGVQLFPIDDEAVLFDRCGQRLFHLNPMATCIWQRLDGYRCVRAIAAAVAASMEFDEAQANHFVRDMLRKWGRLGLLKGGGAHLPRFGDRRTAQQQQLPPAPAAVLAMPLHGAGRHYRMLDTTVAVFASTEKLCAVVHPVLAHLETRAAAESSCRVDIVETADAILIIENRRIVGSCAGRHRLAPLVQGIIGLVALRHFRYLIALHAAALVSADGVLLLAGRSGSGKSTLSAGMLSAGWQYLSDDTALLSPNSLNVVPMPYSLGLKRGSWPLLASWLPNLGRLPVHEREDGKAIRYLGPPRVDFRRERPVRWIGFPHRSENGETVVRRLGRLEGLYRVLEHCCAVPRPLEASDVHQLIRWTGGLEFFELAAGDLDSAVAQIQAITAATPTEDDMRLPL